MFLGKYKWTEHIYGLLIASCYTEDRCAIATKTIFVRQVDPIHYSGAHYEDNDDESLGNHHRDSASFDWFLSLAPARSLTVASC